MKDPKKKSKIINDYDSLKLAWMEKPPESAYSKKGNVLVLDEAKAPPSQAQMFTIDAFFAFSDASLSFFTTINANYMPQVQLGKIRVAERVNMMPALIRLGEELPYSLLGIIAHEAGHKIGPEVAEINGYDLKGAYADLLACYKDKKSINLRKDQGDEAIADYISSEVLARQISRLPAEKRQDALITAMTDFCLFEALDSGINCRGVHPENSLRISGIFGANPNLRKAVGCQGDSPSFKSCGLKNISLPENTAQSKKAKPALPVKAVR